MMKQWKRKMGILLLCAVFGFLVTVQLRSVRTHNQNYVGTEYMRAVELQNELKIEREKREQLYEALLDYQEQLEAFRVEASESGSVASVLSAQLIKTEMLAGIVDVQGPGITVTMNDSDVRSDNDSSVDESLFVIHDDDLLKVVNELRDAGAEAISINGERLLASSEIRCAGATVSVNNNRYATPFIINAIGDPATLEAALMMRRGVVEILGQWGIKITVEKKENLVINGYSGAIRFKYATPVKKSVGE